MKLRHVLVAVLASGLVFAASPATAAPEKDSEKKQDSQGTPPSLTTKGPGSGTKNAPSDSEGSSPKAASSELSTGKYFDSLRSGASQPLSLAEAVTLALENSPDLDLAVASTKLAEAQYQQTKVSRYPILALSGNINQFPADIVVCLAGDIDPCPPGAEITVQESTTIGASAAVQVPLTGQYGLSKRLSAGRYAVEAAEIGREVAKREVVWQVEQAYLQLLKARAIKEASDASVELAAAQVEKVKRYVDVGALGRNDLLQAELGLAQAQQGQIQAEAGVILAEGVLALTVGLPPGTRIEPTEDYPKEVPAIPISLEEASKGALTNRPELIQIDSQLSMSKALKQASQSAYLPQVNLSGIAQYNSGSTFAAEVQFFAGLNVSWTIWDWGLIRSQVVQADASVAQATAQKEKLEQGVTLDVRSRYLTLLGAQASLEVSKKAIESAEENLRITSTRFEAKAATTTDLLDAQVLLTRAVVQEISARYDYYIALAGLKKAMGEPLTDRYIAKAAR